MDNPTYVFFSGTPIPSLHMGRFGFDLGAGQGEGSRNTAFSNAHVLHILPGVPADRPAEKVPLDLIIAGTASVRVYGFRV